VLAAFNRRSAAGIALPQLAGGNDQAADRGDEADQPQEVAVVASDHLVEPLVDLLETLVDLLEALFDLLEAFVASKRLSICSKP
jgi:hypothetical protein